MDPPLSFGDWLQQRRRALALTGEQLAQRVGCSISTLRKLEAGERRPSLQVAELLANALGVAPAAQPTFVKVARGVLNVERLPAPGPQPAQPVPTARPARDRLPVNPTPLIGRQQELAKLGRLLADPACRMLTLVGPGGVGKTRLAIDAARQAAETFADGVAFVPLAPLTSPRFIVPAMAEALGFTFSGPAEPQTQLERYLRDKQLLLVLDNVEHLLAEGGAELLAGLLEGAAAVKFLVTSRAVLDVQAEWVFEVEGLPVRAGLPTHEAAGADAVELFLQRARRVQVGFTPTDDDYGAIVRICQRVEGLPLAIELAATWVRTLSCAEIAQQLESAPERLAVSMRDLPARHRSLQAVFDHSWKLLAEAEQQVLLRLSAFRGGFRREAAEQVAEATLSVLSTLVTKSLIHRSGAGRYHLHELIRQYAAERFAERPEEQAAVRARHGRYYLTWIIEHEAALTSSRQKETIEQLTVEIDNLRQAWEWAIDQRMIELLRLAAWPLWHSYEVRGLYREGEAMFLEAVQSMLNWNSPNEIEDETRRATFGYLQIFQASLTLRQGRIEEAEQVLKDCLNPLKSTNDRAGLANAFVMHGVACMFMGKFAQAIEPLQEALAHALAANRHWEASLSRILIGRMEYQLGDYNESKRWIAEGLALVQKMGDPNLITFGISSLVETEHALGHLDEMEALLRAGIQMAADNGNRFTYAMLQEQLAMVLHSTGNTHDAQQLCQASVDLYRELGDEWSISRALNLLGNFELEEDEQTQALPFFLDALEVASKAHSYANALDALTGIAAIQAINQDNLLTFELTWYILQSPFATHQAQNASNRLLKEFEARLTPEQIKAAKASAQAHSFDQIVEKVTHLAVLYTRVTIGKANNTIKIDAKNTAKPT